MLGKLIKETGLFTLENMIMSMEKSIEKKDLLEMNIKALKLGFDYAG